MTPATPGVPAFCAFCGKSNSEVQRMFAGPGVFICEPCVQSAVEFIADAEGLAGDRRVEEVVDRIFRREPRRMTAGDLGMPDPDDDGDAP